MQQASEHLLVTLGKERFGQPKQDTIRFIDDTQGNALLNDLERFPHAFVLACCMDRQITAERAWAIPMKVRDLIGDFSIEILAGLSLSQYQDMFREQSFHRFNDVMAGIFHAAVQRIAREYDGNAASIWSNNPCSAAVVYRFLQFEGVGIKIATMATNILARDFRVPLSDYYSIDISPDVHILRVLRRSGLVSPEAEADAIIYKARELHPGFPGVIDLSCWEIGRTWCRPTNPDCANCIIHSVCEKRLK